jgi:glycosyltransferase involved in cell wall biosynthesis
MGQSMKTKTPLLSVVIPTYKRPHYLPRAVESALRAAPNGDVEIIVVPNGSDESWKVVAENFAGEHRVKWHSISIAHACAARNHGLSLAAGKYIRFLDDDDYLFKDSISQIEELDSGGYELCSGKIISVDMDGSQIGILDSPKTDDFVVATTQVTGLPLPVGNVFLKNSIMPFRWSEQVNRTQDNIWMYTLAGGREWKWKQSNKVVGAWFHHDQDRISTTQLSKDPYPAAIPALEQLWAALKTSGRINEERRAAIAQALWWHIHLRFPHQPLYWNRIARVAASIDSSAKPNHPLFHSPPLKHVPPIIIEWLIYPERWLKGRFREIRDKSSPMHYVRNF